MNGASTNLTPWITEKFISAAPVAAAKALGTLATHEAVLLIKPLKAEAIIACLNPMDSAKAAAILRRLPARQAAHVLARLDIMQAGAIYKAFSMPQREKMKTLLSASLVKTLEGNTRWSADSAGALMSRDFVIFKTEQKIREIIEKLKTIPRKKLSEACLVVSGKDGKLKGMIRYAELVFFESDLLAGSVMGEVKSILPQAKADNAHEILRQGQPFVPVADEDGVPLGVLSWAELQEVPIARKKKFGWF